MKKNQYILNSRSKEYVVNSNSKQNSSLAHACSEFKSDGTQLGLGQRRLDSRLVLGAQGLGFRV